MAKHDEDLEAAVKAWCDAELLSDEGWQRGTLVGEWHLVVSRQGFDEDGDAISQTFTTSSHSSPSRLLGLLGEATIKLEQWLRGYYRDEDAER